MLTCTHYFFFLSFFLSSLNECWIKSYHTLVSQADLVIKSQNTFVQHSWVSVLTSSSKILFQFSSKIITPFTNDNKRHLHIYINLLVNFVVLNHTSTAFIQHLRNNFQYFFLVKWKMLITHNNWAFHITTIWYTVYQINTINE